MSTHPINSETGKLEFTSEELIVLLASIEKSEPEEKTPIKKRKTEKKIKSK
jgi:hypothetical protein